MCHTSIKSTLETVSGSCILCRLVTYSNAKQFCTEKIFLYVVEFSFCTIANSALSNVKFLEQQTGGNIFFTSEHLMFHCGGKKLLVSVLRTFSKAHVLLLPSSVFFRGMQSGQGTMPPLTTMSDEKL